MYLINWTSYIETLINKMTIHNYELHGYANQFTNYLNTGWYSHWEVLKTREVFGMLGFVWGCNYRPAYRCICEEFHIHTVSNTASDRQHNLSIACSWLDQNISPSHQLERNISVITFCFVASKKYHALFNIWNLIYVSLYLAYICCFT